MQSATHCGMYTGLGATRSARRINLRFVRQHGVGLVHAGTTLGQTNRIGQVEATRRTTGAASNGATPRPGSRVPTTTATRARALVLDQPPGWPALLHRRAQTRSLRGQHVPRAFAHRPPALDQLCGVWHAEVAKAWPRLGRERERERRDVLVDLAAVTVKLLVVGCRERRCQFRIERHGGCDSRCCAVPGAHVRSIAHVTVLAARVRFWGRSLTRRRGPPAVSSTRERKSFFFGHARRRRVGAKSSGTRRQGALHQRCSAQRGSGEREQPRCPLSCRQHAAAHPPLTNNANPRSHGRPREKDRKPPLLHADATPRQVQRTGL